MVLRGVHINLLTPTAEQLLRDARPALVKTLDHRPNWAQLKAECGIQFLLGRVWMDQEADFSPTPERAAERLWGLMAPVLDRHRGTYDAIETPWNERAQRVGEGLDMHAAACRRFCELAAAEGWRVAVGNFSVGNPEPEELAEHFAPALEVADYLSVHEYWLPGRPGVGWWTHRWRRVWEALPPNLRRPIIISECGIDGGLEFRPAETAGWRAYDLTGEQYVAELDRYYQELDQRVVGIAVFNAGDYSPGRWGSFEVADVPEFAAWLRQREEETMAGNDTEERLRRLEAEVELLKQQMDLLSAGIDAGARQTQWRRARQEHLWATTQIRPGEA